MKRKFIELKFFVLAIAVAGILFPLQSRAASRPNIIIMIADDMGWKDTGYNGNTIVKTPVLDEMAARGVRFDYFYPAGAVCNPGRYGILTGRTPLRGGMTGNVQIAEGELLLPRTLAHGGYKSAYYGKWRLGVGPTSPQSMGFDEAIWKNGGFELDPVFNVGDGKEMIHTKGDGSVAIMNLALQFIRRAAAGPNPFLLVIGFASPHSPWEGAPQFQSLFKTGNEKYRNAWAEISGIDAAIGNLRNELRRLEIADQTMIWYTSDNAGNRKDSRDPTARGKGNIGVRTVGLLEWPGRVKGPMRITIPCGHVDIYPTIMEATGVNFPRQPVVDGISLLPILDGKTTTRSKPLGFLSSPGRLEPQDFTKEVVGTWIDTKYKLIESSSKTRPYRLFDILEDPSETTDLIERLPKVVARMRGDLEKWKMSVRDSYTQVFSSAKRPVAAESESD